MLTPAQAAFLAALPQRPTRVQSATANLAPAPARQRTVLRRMARPRRARRRSGCARRSRERSALGRGDAPFLAPHFVEMVLAASRRTPQRRRAIETTLDAGAAARRSKASSRSSAPSLDAHGAHNVAVVVLDNAPANGWRGKARATIGDAEHGGAINGPLVPRQPGSALKPFTYALAFEAGLHAGDRAAPTFRRTSRPPRRASSTGRATTTAGIAVRCSRAGALAGSENVPAVALASELGVRDAAALPDARRLHDVRSQTADVLRPRRHARQRRGAARQLVGGVCGVRARRRRGREPTCPSSAGLAPPKLRRRASSPAHGLLDHRHPLRRRRARVHLRPRRQPRVSRSRSP